MGPTFISLLSLLLAFYCTISSCQGTGQWSDLIPFDLVPVAAYVVPEYPISNSVLVFSANARDNFGGGGGRTQFSLYNHADGTVTPRTVAETNHDMFCPGISSLADDRLVISGGQNAEAVTIYNPASNTFTRGPNMRIPRGYQTSVTLSNGRVFTIGGSWSGGVGGKNGEVFNPATNSWNTLSGATATSILTRDREGAYRSDNHAWLFPWRDGSVFHAGPSTQMNWISTSGSGSVRSAGTRSNVDAMNGVSVMFDVGRIFTAGGSPDYINADAIASAHVITIGTVGQAAQVQTLPSMAEPRVYANAVVLPDGTVFINGGQHIGRQFTDDQSVLTPELFDPATMSFRRLATSSEPRNYHSVSLLLADGTIFTGGGGLCGSSCTQRGWNHFNGDIFTPPYLLNNGQPAQRPVITALSSSSGGGPRITVRPGGRLTVTLQSGGPTVQRFALMRIGSATHSINSDQRRIPLNPTSRNGNQITVTLPSDSGVVPPGPYFLFAMSEGGVPSVAWTVSVQV